jgi:uncharacterized membrane protein YdfJ with MMPL/SSD domain
VEQKQVNDVLLNLTKKVEQVSTENKYQTQLLEAVVSSIKDHEHRITNLESLVKVGAVLFAVLAGVLSFSSRFLPALLGLFR